MMGKANGKSKKLLLFVLQGFASSKKLFCVFGGHKRRSTERLMQAPLESLGFRSLSQAPELATYLQIGVGVYRGGFVGIRRWAFGSDTQSHRWLVHNLKYENLHSELPQLLQDAQALICFLCQYDIQSLSAKTDSQTQGGLKQETYFCEHRVQLYREHSSEDEENNSIPANLHPERKVSEQSKQLQRWRCPYARVYQE